MSTVVDTLTWQFLILGIARLEVWVRRLIPYPQGTTTISNIKVKAIREAPETTRTNVSLVLQ